MPGKQETGFLENYARLGLVEIIGEDAVEDFRKQASEAPLDLVVRGTLHRAGRAAFNYWLHLQHQPRTWITTDFRFSPVKKKITTGLADICAWLGMNEYALLTMENREKAWEILLEKTPSGQHEFTINRCSFLAGFFQEFTSWAGLGKAYLVREESCILRGDNRCRIVIAKNPLD